MTTLKKEILNKIWTFLRIFVGLGLLVFVLWRFDLNKILHNIRGMDIRYLLYALIPYLCFIIIAAWRWQVLLVHKNFKIPFPQTIVIFFISLFFNNLLPTTVGGDVMRVVYSMKEKKADALGIVLADRILGFIGLFVFALASVLYLLIFKDRGEFLSMMIIGLVVLILISYILFSGRGYSLFSPVIEGIKIFHLGDRLNRLHKTMTDFGGAWGVIILCIAQSVIIQVLLAISPFLILKSMHIQNISLLPFFIYVPIINVISMIPISLNGLGVRENTYVLLFSRIGLPGAISITMSLVSFFLTFLYSLVGGIAFIFYKKK